MLKENSLWLTYSSTSPLPFLSMYIFFTPLLSFSPSFSLPLSAPSQLIVWVMIFGQNYYLSSRMQKSNKSLRDYSVPPVSLGNVLVAIKLVQPIKRFHSSQWCIVQKVHSFLSGLFQKSYWVSSVLDPCMCVYMCACVCVYAHIGLAFFKDCAYF